MRRVVVSLARSRHALWIVALSLAACSGDGPNAPLAPDPEVTRPLPIPQPTLPAPTIVRLTVSPDDASINLLDQITIEVVAEFSDGRRIKVTGLPLLSNPIASYSSSPSGIVSIGVLGTVKAIGVGTTEVRVECGGQVAYSRIKVIAPWR